MNTVAKVSAETRRDDAILNWKNAQAQMAYWKETELLARNAAIECCFQEPPESGTQNYELANGFKLKAVFKTSLSIAKGEPLEAALSKIEATGERGKLIAERVIRWNPALDKKEYDLMPDELRAILDTVITSAPGTPSLELVEPAVTGEPKRAKR